MKPYEKYKESGVEWIGEIPEHWNNLRIKYLVNGGDTLFIDGNWIESDIITEDGIRYLTSGNIGPGFYKEQGNGFVSEDTFISNNFTEVFPGDLLISRLNEPIGRACIIPDLGNRIVTCVDNVILRPKTTIDKRYLMFLMNSKEYSNVTSLISRGATMKRISRSLLGQIKIPIPPKAEQTAIANFLDHQTAIIDELIEKKTKQIALLKEKRQAIINETVTKGLDPTAKMKDSGVEWLGEIPESWEIKKLKFIIEKIVGGGTPSTSNPEYWEGDIPWVSAKDMKVNNLNTSEDFITEKGLIESSTSLIEEGNILIVVRSGILKHSFPVAINTVKVTINQDLKAIYVQDRLLVKYLFWYFKGVEKAILTFCYKVGATVESIDMEKFLAFPIPIFSLTEQEQIVNFIEQKTEIINDTLWGLQDSIEKLKEYRQSLISEAVTGKIDVRGWQSTV